MSERAALINHLDALGFYAYTDPARVAVAKRRAAEGGYRYGEETKRFFDLLVRAGSDERVYDLGGAEDGAAVFLTPAMVEFIHDHRSLEDGWIPE